MERRKYYFLNNKKSSKITFDPQAFCTNLGVRICFDHLLLRIKFDGVYIPIMLLNCYGYVYTSYRILNCFFLFVRGYYEILIHLAFEDEIFVKIDGCYTE